MKNTNNSKIRYCIVTALLLAAILLISLPAQTASAITRRELANYDLNGNGSVEIADVSYLLNILAGHYVLEKDREFSLEDGGVRYYIEGEAQKGFVEIDGDLLYFDPETGLMSSSALTLDGWAYDAPQAFVKNGMTLYRYGAPILVPKQINMRQIPLNYNKNDCVSTKYDPHTYTEGASTSWYLWYATDYIDVSNDYAVSYCLSGHKYLQSIAFYDAGKKYISGRAIGTTSDCVTIRETVVLPAGTKYVRCTNRLDGGPMTLNDSYLYALAGEEDYAEYMRQHPTADKKVVLIGDSLTEGDMGSNRSGVTNKTTYNYPYYLSHALDCRAESDGHCGITVSGYFSHYGAGNTDISDADLVLVMLGTNGGIKDDTTAQSYRNLIKLIKADLKQGARIVLVTPPHATEIQGKVNYGYNDNVISAAEFVRSFAAEKGYDLIDAYANSPIKEENEDLYQPNDGLHMNAAGYEAFADFIAQELRNQGLWQ